MGVSESFNLKDIDQTAAALKQGGVAVFETDTVLGAGLAVCAAETPQALFELKRRPASKPIAWLVGSPEDLDRYGWNVPEYAREFARTWWPGALTLIVTASAEVPKAYRSAQGTIGLRMPNSAQALQLIKQVGCPLATTSANAADALPPASLAAADPAFVSRVAAVLRPEEAQQSGVASTIVDCTGPSPRVLRQGAISAADIDNLMACTPC